MKNKEKFIERILDLAGEGETIALSKRTGKIVPCENLSCASCKFFEKELNCSEVRKIWFEEEYVEEYVDWSTIPVDTQVLVSDDGENWNKRYFAEFKNGEVFCYENGTTSWSSELYTVGWKYAKLFLDWSKVPVDTPILVKQHKKDKWVKRYFAKYEDGIVYAFPEGNTSKTYSLSCLLSWEYAILFEESNVEEYDE